MLAPRVIKTTRPRDEAHNQACSAEYFWKNFNILYGNFPVFFKTTAGFYYRTILSAGQARGLKLACPPVRAETRRQGGLGACPTLDRLSQ
jgi:hypothetical protein